MGFKARWRRGGGVQGLPLSPLLNYERSKAVATPLLLAYLERKPAFSTSYDPRGSHRLSFPSIIQIKCRFSVPPSTCEVRAEGFPW